MNLTDHFTLEELTHSDTAVRLGIDNTPPAEILPNLLLLAQGLEDCRILLSRPINVTSGYRCEALERVLCAKDFAAWCRRRSRDADEQAWREYFARKGHPQGYCADWTCRSFGTPRSIVRLLSRSGIKFDQLIEEGTWVHSSFDPRMRGEILSATFAPDGTPSYTREG